MRACLIDLRCLQDPNYAERGVGRHATALLSHARDLLPGVELVGIADRAMPALPTSVRALCDQVRGNAYTGALDVRCCHVQLSPMTHDPMFVARLLHHPAIPAATVVYDFIPLEEPERYLPDDETRLDYHVSLRWLARHRLFLPISESAASGLKRLLHVPEHRIAVTGAALAPAFDTLPPAPPRHVLVVAGPDRRKNPECAVRAHARSAALQADGIPLIVTGAYDDAWLEQQRALAESLGGRPELVQAPGHLEESALLALYAGALCVVSPSRAEGFSLPVVEAMAAGIPVLASDIPAHRELLDQGLFPPDDDAALARLLEPVRDPAWREAARQRQAAIWPRFRARQVAERFWSAVAGLSPRAAPAVHRHRPRLAFITPLPPDRSGVADYSEATCAELGKRVDLHVFTPTTGAALPPGAATLAPLSALPVLSTAFDRVVHVMGNSAYHLGILQLMLRYGGAAIQHDSRMLDLYAIYISRTRTMEMAEAELGRALLPNEFAQWLNGERAPKALILSEVAAAAEPLMMHAQASVDEMARRYGRTARYLPFSLYRTISEEELAPSHRTRARQDLGIQPGQVLLASFGAVHTTKAPVDCVWALDLLRSWGVDARLHFVGAPMMALDPLRSLIRELGLDPHVMIGNDHFGERSYRDHLLAADVALQLRTTGPGSLSGAIADCIVAGLPTVASAGLADGMDAPGYIRRVPDAPSPVLIAEATMALLPGRATDDERRAYMATRGLDRYAARLCAALDLS